MLYVFQVDTGQMLNFEMDVAISTVHTLKSKIMSVQGIPLDKQVLLVSGGEILDGASRVCNYAAGTDTNPIFLFNKLNIEQQQGGQESLIQQQLSSGSDGGTNNVNLADLETIHKQIQDASTLPSTYMSVVTRTQLAQHIYDMGKEITRKCELLIHHQHLQHQGWAAVVANLDDIVTVFNSKMVAFSAAYEGFFGEYSKELIDSFVDGLDSTLKTLDTIKLPHYHNPTDKQEPQSISQWLSNHFPSQSPNPLLPPTSPLAAHLHSIATSTRKTHSHLTSPNFLQSLQADSTTASEKASSPNMKEIKGLEERLYGLDQLLQEAKKIVLDQHELTQAFHQNVSRASDLRDSSIFPDLCASHQHQLLVMYKNHSQLEDIRRRCGRAKEELTYNLNTRLKWVAFVQKSLSEMGGKISVFHESLKRLRVHVNVLQQISTCEVTYNEYVREVGVRGRVGKRLGKLQSRIVLFNQLAEAETHRRIQFREQFASHFLSQAFGVLVEDRTVNSVPVPTLIDYICEDDTDDEPTDCCDCGGSSSELITRLKDLERTIETLRSTAGSYEHKIRSLETSLESETAKVAVLKNQMADCRMKSRLESERAGKLSAQVGDLKKLIDEFRVKEEEVIRVHGEEVGEYERRLRGMEGKCDERVVELTRMLEFEWGQKLKAVEDSHKLNYDAMLNRFKLVNKSVFSGSNERITGPVSPAANKQEAPHRGRSVMMSPQHMLFSDEEEEDDDLDDYDLGMRGDRRRRVKRESIVEAAGGMEVDEAERFDNAGSLERAVDAAKFLEGEEKEAVVDTKEVVVPDSVVKTATRLNKLSRISISTCRVGSEPNLFYWNDKFNAFTVYLNNRNVHFLNMGDQPKNPNTSFHHHDPITPSKTQLFIGNITDKEFCVARRAQNRYNVPQGFHFYRVKCKIEEVVEEV